MRSIINFNTVACWVSSNLLYKLGFFGVDWKYGPFFDNKAAFQLGVNEIVRRTSFEAVDRLGRVRGTSQIDQNLQDARQNINYTEDAWYVSTSPFGFLTPTPASHSGRSTARTRPARRSPKQPAALPAARCG